MHFPAEHQRHQLRYKHSFTRRGPQAVGVYPGGPPIYEALLLQVSFCLHWTHWFGIPAAPAPLSYPNWETRQQTNETPCDYNTALRQHGYCTGLGRRDL